METPIPDPTVLTTEQLHREVRTLRELIETRITAIDTATRLYNVNAKLIHDGLSKEILHLKELEDEKFCNVQTQFKERDTRVEQTARDTKVAVDAALQAAEKAVGRQNEAFGLSINKSEQATTKQIDGILKVQESNNNAVNDKIDNNFTSVNDKIAEVGARQNREEGKSSGHDKSQSVYLAVAAVLIALLTMAYSIFHGQQEPQIVVSPPTSISAPAKTP